MQEEDRKELENLVIKAIEWSHKTGISIVIGTNVEKNSVSGYTITDREDCDVLKRMEDIR